jgi:hypothetical protein
VPASALQCLRLLRGLTAVRCPSNELLVGKRWPTVNPNAAAIIMDLQATAMVRQPENCPLQPAFCLCSDGHCLPDLHIDTVPLLRQTSML